MLVAVHAHLVLTRLLNMSVEVQNARRFFSFSFVSVLLSLQDNHTFDSLLILSCGCCRGKQVERACDDIEVTTCHSYVINHKFNYACGSCGRIIGRHSRSIDTDKAVCTHFCSCPSFLSLLMNRCFSLLPSLSLFPVSVSLLGSFRLFLNMFCSGVAVAVRCGFFRQRRQTARRQRRALPTHSLSS